MKNVKLTDILDDLTVETLDADNEDIDSLWNLDITNIVRYHVKNYALQNNLKYTIGNCNVRKKNIKF